LSDFYKQIVNEELNVKEIIFSNDVREFTTYNFKPQLKTVGPKYGKQLGGIQKELAVLDGNAAMDTLRETGSLKFDINGVEVLLTEEDLLIEMIQKEGYVTEADNQVTVVIDTKLTPELIEEGFVYEIISKIQTMRKEADFEVMDHIDIYVNDNDKIVAIINRNSVAIKEKVLAEVIVLGELKGYIKEWNINGEKVNLGVEKK